MWKETFVKRLSLQLLESFIGAVTQEHYLHNNYLYNSSRINWNSTSAQVIRTQMWGIYPSRCKKLFRFRRWFYSSLYSIGTRMLFVCRLQNGWRNDKPKGVWSIPDLSFLSLKKCISKLLFTRWGHLWIMLGKDSETLSSPPSTHQCYNVIMWPHICLYPVCSALCTHAWAPECNWKQREQ